MADRFKFFSDSNQTLFLVDLEMNGVDFTVSGTFLDTVTVEQASDWVIDTARIYGAEVNSEVSDDDAG